MTLLLTESVKAAQKFSTNESSEVMSVNCTQQAHVYQPGWSAMIKEKTEKDLIR